MDQSRIQTEVDRLIKELTPNGKLGVVLFRNHKFQKLIKLIAQDTRFDNDIPRERVGGTIKRALEAHIDRVRRQKMENEKVENNRITKEY